MGTKRRCSLVLALALALSLALPARAAEEDGRLIPKVTEAPAFSDTAGAWCEAEVSTVCEAGLMEGRSADRFAPQDTLMPEHAVAVCARLYSLLTGGDDAVGPAAEGEAWYQPYYDYLAESLDYTGGSEALMLNFHAAKYPAKRWHFVDLLCRTLEAAGTELPAINDVTVLPDSADLAVLALYRAGILTGSDESGTFDGNGILNRGQAAVILARLADPSLRVLFTLEPPCYSRELLGLEPDTVMLTVDGCSVSAESYLACLTRNIAAMEAALAAGCYDEYPQYYEEYLKDPDYPGDFPAFLRERHGIDIRASLDWDAPDAGGMTPAQKVLADTLQDVKELAVLLARQEEFPLTSRQEREVEEALAAGGLSYGYSEDFARQQLASLALMENMSARYGLSASDLTDLLAEEGYVFGQYVAIYRGDRGAYPDDETALAAAQSVRQTLMSHMDDPEYREFLIWKYSEDYNIAPDLLPASVLSGESFKILLELGIDRVSPVLEEDQFYMVVIKLDPTEDEELLNTANSLAAQARVTQWAEAADTVLSPACGAVDPAAVARAMAALEI